MYLLALVRVADQPRSLVKQQDMLVFIEDGDLRSDLRIEGILALRRFEECIVHIEVDRAARGEDGLLAAALCVHLDAPRAQEFTDLTHARGGQGLLQEAGQTASVPFAPDLNAFHSENLSLITRSTPSSSLPGAMYLAMAFSFGCALSMA